MNVGPPELHLHRAHTHMCEHHCLHQLGPRGAAARYFRVPTSHHEQRQAGRWASLGLACKVPSKVPDIPSFPARPWALHASSA